MSSTDAGWVITLVHGTWARGVFNLDKATGKPRWFENGSRFMEHLIWRLRDANVTGTQIEVCLWSGENSILAREEAAKQLAEQLAAQRRSNPNARQVVVAHSHGGNVAIRALEHLGDNADHLLVATLSTPFLEIFPPDRDSVPFDKFLFLFTGFVNFAVAAIWLTGAYIPRALLFVVGALYILAGLIAAREFLALRRRRRQIVPSAFVDLLGKCASHAALQRRKTDLLVLRGVDDEAALSIAAGALGRRLATLNAWLINNAIARIYVPIAVVVVSGIAALAILPASLSHFIFGILYSRSTEQFALMVAGALYLGIIAIFVSFVISAACLAVYGRELFFTFLNAEISVNSAPDTRGRVAIYTLIRGESTSSGRLRHSIYDEAECPAHIVFWAKRRFAGEEYVSEYDSRRSYSIPTALYEEQMRRWGNQQKERK